jgi:hypothetical protein
LIIWKNCQYLFHLDVLLKQTRPGYKNPDVIIKAYPIDRRTCVMTVLKEYLKQTHELRANTRQLFISYIKSYKAVYHCTLCLIGASEGNRLTLVKVDV